MEELYERTPMGIGNEMQRELAKKHDDFFEEAHLISFRETLDAHPEFIQEYETYPEETLKKIEEIIYH